MYTSANFLNNHEMVLSHENKLLLMDSNYLNILKKFEENDYIEFLSVSQNKKWIFTKVGQNINKWDIETGNSTSFYNPDYFEVYKIITDNENQYLFCSGETFTLVWDFKTKNLIQKLETANYANVNYLLSLDSKNELLLTSDRECNLFFWNIKTWKNEEIIKFEEPFIDQADFDYLVWDFRLSTFCIFNPQNDDEVLICFPNSNKISKYNIKNREIINNLFILTDNNIIYYMDLTDDKTTLIIVDVYYPNSFLKLFNIETGECLKTVELGKFLRVDSVSINDLKNKFLISGFYGSFLYDLNLGKLIKQLSIN